MAYKLGDIIEFKKDCILTSGVFYKKGDVAIVSGECHLEKPSKDTNKETVKFLKRAIARNMGREMVRILRGPLYYTFKLSRPPETYKKIGNLKKDISYLLEDL